MPSTAPPKSSNIDAEALARELKKNTSGEIRFDAGSRALYATDSSNYRQVPIGIVVPKTKEDIIETVKLCRRFGAPILSRGGGTSLAGQCCNVAVVMDMSKYYNRILELDIAGKTARVQPGLVLDHLRKPAEKHNLTFAPDPSTHDHCTLGGMIGNNSCGTHSVMGGTTVDNVISLEVLTYDGLRLEVGPTSDREYDRIIAGNDRRAEIYKQMRLLRDRYADRIRQRYPNIPRRISGYNLNDLLPENGFNVARALVGTESTCATVLEASLRLVPHPPHPAMLVLGYPDVYSAADHVPDVLEHGPMACEGIDLRLTELMRKKPLHVNALPFLPEGQGWLFVEFGGYTPEEAAEKARRAMAALKKLKTAPAVRLYTDPKVQKELWNVRESGLGATAFVPGERDAWEGWEDSAVPVDKLPHYLRDLRALMKRYSYDSAMYGHFGQGCVHCRIQFDLITQEGLRNMRRFLDEAADLIVKYGGSLSGEHGDGQSKAELLPKMFGPEIVGAFREFKTIWDPEFKMNPGKIVDPYPILSNLRLGAHYNPPRKETVFQFMDDQNDFARAAMRCVGVGQCRHSEGGTMCPSYMVTKEEMHSTRGRAHLLFEMMQGDVLKGGWRDPHVREALDLCLACKGCKSDCPVNVDLATYKAEFLSHYYKGRLRPIHAYAIGLIPWWARLASHMPGLVNAVTQSRVLGPAFKWFGGIAPQRSVPKFAPQTFRDWFRQRPIRHIGKPQVMLWPDTFNNHFFPKVEQAATDVLEAVGFQVIVPSKPLCCGRPLYDYGMLGLAKKFLLQILDTLRPQIRQGIPLVVLEPSCGAVFRDELLNLFPHDVDAQRLKRQTFYLGEFVTQKARHYIYPKLNVKALLHGHCHQKALAGMEADEVALKNAGVDYELLDSGCCGMAGGFGFEKEHYDISVQVGERSLLPRVRQAPPQTWIVTNGFSCREQVSQLAGREPLHLAEVLQKAIHSGTPAGRQAGPVSAPESKSAQREMEEVR